MKIDITRQPDPDIFHNKRKYTLWFVFFLLWTFTAVGMGVYTVYFPTFGIKQPEDIALGTLVGAALGITWFGNKLQAYKRLYPPHLEKLADLRSKHPIIEEYCVQVEAMGRRLIRAEYEACIDYSESHSEIPFI